MPSTPLASPPPAPSPSTPSSPWRDEEEGAANRRRAAVDVFFSPQGVAVLGKLPPADRMAEVARQHDRRWGPGNWHLVNPRGGEVAGLAVHSDVGALVDGVGRIDLAIVNVPASRCPDAVAACGRAGVRVALVQASGFSETGPAGAELERQLLDAARDNGVRLVGPNTNTNMFEPIDSPNGSTGRRIGLVTHSGHNGRPVVSANRLGVAFSRQVPCGNEVDLDICDFIEHFARDAGTGVIAGYVEGFKDLARARAAFEAANASGTPVVLVVVGATTAGARMAASHTGHLTGQDAIVDGLLRQHGVIRVRDLDELLETATVLAKLPPHTGPRAALYSISGGSNTLMAELAESHGVPVPELSPATQDRLHHTIPAYLTVRNPVDNGGALLLTTEPEARRDLLRAIAADPAVDVIVVGITGALGPLTERFCQDVRTVSAEVDTPIVATWNSPLTDDPGFDELVASGIPVLRSFRGCFAALAAFARYRTASTTFRHRPLPRPAGGAVACAPGVGATDEGLTDEGSGRHGRATLDEAASRALLVRHDLPLAREALATSAAEAVAHAEAIGHPVVLKVASTEIAHRSDLDLVRLDLRSAEAVAAAFHELTERAAAVAGHPAVDGIIVQEMVTDGVECLVGVVHDPLYGPALVVGLGGIFTEVLGDSGVRPLPVDRLDAHEMVQALRGYPLLTGARNRPMADVEALVDVLVGVAGLAAELGPQLVELDLNPVLVRPRGKGAVIVDRLVITEPAAAAAPHTETDLGSDPDTQE